MWLMKTLLTSRCINQRGAGHTLQRIDWVINQIEHHYRFIADKGGLFYDNEGKSKQVLLSNYAQKRQQAQRYLLNASTAG